MTVHHIQMKHIRSCGGHFGCIFTGTAEVCGKQTGGNQHSGTGKLTYIVFHILYIL